ncbi:hypothetical protein COO55_34770 [Rhodococcus opacus]|nr:hypothetical protein COO55_34770 [Rhodococcus opacus]
MNSNGGPTVVIAPGLRDHVAEHSQTLLADRLDRVRVVPPLAHDKLRPAARIAALDAAFAQVEVPVVLVTHSAGVLIAVHLRTPRAGRRPEYVPNILSGSHYRNSDNGPYPIHRPGTASDDRSGPHDWFLGGWLRFRGNDRDGQPYSRTICLCAVYRHDQLSAARVGQQWHRFRCLRAGPLDKLRRRMVHGGRRRAGRRTRTCPAGENHSKTQDCELIQNSHCATGFPGVDRLFTAGAGRAVRGC